MKKMSSLDRFFSLLFVGFAVIVILLEMRHVSPLRQQCESGNTDACWDCINASGDGACREALFAQSFLKRVQ